MLIRTLPLALAGALIALPVLAQTPAPAPTAAPAPAATAPATPASTAKTTRRVSAVERRISMLHSTLKITANEEQPFNAFAQVMRDSAAQMDTTMAQRQQSISTMTAVDAMKSYQSVAHQHADDMDKMVPAFTTLYNALTPAQQKQADKSFQSFTAGGRGQMRSQPAKG